MYVIIRYGLKNKLLLFREQVGDYVMYDAILSIYIKYS